MKRKPTSTVRTGQPTWEGGSAAPQLGVLVAAERGRPWVRFQGDAGEAAPARSLVPLSGPALREAVAQRREVVLLFEEGDPARPIILGFLQPDTETPALDAAFEATLSGEPRTAEVDGKRRVIDAEQELVLRCGKASITLKRDGKVLIRGVQVETHAAGTNRIKGATVKIN